MNKKMRRKILGGLLYKLNILLNDPGVSNKTELLDLQSRTVATLLIENIGIAGYNKNSIYLILSGNDIKIPRKNIENILGPSTDALLSENLRIYQDSFTDKEPAEKSIATSLPDRKSIPIEPKKEEELKKEELIPPSVSPDRKVIAFTPKSEPKKTEEIPPDALFSDDSFSVNLFEYDPPEPEPEPVIKEKPVEKEEKRKPRLTEEELLEKMRR